MDGKGTEVRATRNYLEHEIEIIPHGDRTPRRASVELKNANVGGKMRMCPKRFDKTSSPKRLRHAGSRPKLLDRGLGPGFANERRADEGGLCL